MEKITKFVLLKKIVNISTALLLCFSIVLGYAGVPVFRMVCGKAGGHVLVSVTDPKADCAHNADEADDCCKPKNITRAATTCCDYSSDFFQLKDAGTVQQVKNLTDHQQFQAAVFLPGYGQTPYSPEQGSYLRIPPPDKPSGPGISLSFLSVFRI